MNNKKSTPWFKTDIPLFLLLALAVLAIPRVVIHDLRLLDFDSVTYRAFAIVPLAIWALVAIVRKTSRPVFDFMVLGLAFGFMLAITHQITWDASWGTNIPRIGGNLAGQLSPAAEGMILRVAAFISSLLTGLISGAALALLASAARRIRILKKAS